MNPTSNFRILNNLRNLDRIHKGELEYLQFEIRWLPESEWYRVQLLDYHLQGFGLSISKKLLNNAAFQTGQMCSLRIQQERFVGQIECWIRHIESKADCYHMGLERQPLSEQYVDHSDQRQSSRIELPPFPTWSVYLPSPFLLQTWHLAQICDINSKLGLSLIVQDSSLLIFNGITIKIFFPGDSWLPLIAKVIWISNFGNDKIKIGVQIKSPPLKTLEYFSDRLVKECDLNPWEVEAFGFQPHHIKQILTYKWIKTPREYEDILGLRAFVYKRLGLTSIDAKVESLSCPDDRDGLILGAFKGKSCIASFTLLIPLHDKIEYEWEKHVPSHLQITSLPPKTQHIFLTEFVLHPDYQATDIFHGIIEQFVRCFLLSKRQYLTLLLHRTWMEPFIELGFEKCGINFLYPRFNQNRFFLLSQNRSHLLRGKKMKSRFWKRWIAPLLQELRAQNSLKIPWPTRIKLKLLKN